jgi:hypothetical protein
VGKTPAVQYSGVVKGNTVEGKNTVYSGIQS